MPLLVAIGLKQRESTAEIEEFRSALRQFGPDEEQRIAKSTLEMLKQFDFDRAVAAAEKEFLPSTMTSPAGGSNTLRR